MYANDGQPFAASHYHTLRDELTSEFGGMTAYTRAPAQGTWAADAEGTKRDDILIYEVMVESIDRPWWTEYRRKLERRFQQDELVIRAQAIERL